MSTYEARLNKLKFRAWPRGFREADLILGPFADQHVATFSPEELDTFERLLEVPDQDLYAWIIGREPTPAEYDHQIMNRIKQFRWDAHEARGENNGG